MYSRIRNQQISSSFRSSNAIYVSTCNNELAECPALTAALPHTQALTSAKYSVIKAGNTSEMTNNDYKMTNQ